MRRSRKPTSRRATRLAFGLGLGVASAACGDPCRELSERVCSCEPTVRARQACLQQVERRAGQGRPPSGPGVPAPSRQVCHELLAGCTCAALAAGQLSACGLGPAADTL